MESVNLNTAEEKFTVETENNAERRIVEKIGFGNEGTCYRTDRNTVIKIPHWFGKIWQTQSKEYIIKCLTALHEEKIPCAPVKILQNTQVTHLNGEVETVPLAIEMPFYQIDPITYRDFLDPEKGPDRIRLIMDNIIKTDRIYQQHKYGVDLLGAQAVVDLTKGLVKCAIMEISQKTPQNIRENIRKKIGNVSLTAHNLTKVNGTALLIDPGMHNLSGVDVPTFGLPTHVNRFLNSFMYVSFIEILKTAAARLNENLPPERQVPIEEIENLPHNGSEWETKLVEFLIKKVEPLL